MSVNNETQQQQQKPPPAELLRAILTRLAEKLSDAELARMMDTNPRYIARWRAGINVPRHLERTVYLCLGISLDHSDHQFSYKLLPDPETEAIRFSGLILRGVALGVGFWIVGRVLPPVIAFRQRRRASIRGQP